MAPLRHALPNDCNVLFFDARGHGESTGSLLHQPWRYGIDEYRDILAVMDWTFTHNPIPIILYGSCAGAFNMVHALKYIDTKTNHQSLKESVKGIIFDSGWASVLEASKSGLYAKTIQLLYLGTNKLFGKKIGGCINKLWSYTLIQQILRNTLLILHYIAIRPFITPTESVTSLYSTFKKLTIPILVIHAQDDTWIDYKKARKIAALCSTKHVWWITKPSLHAAHHVLHYDEYKQQIKTFLHYLAL
jgi:pimeloyl-ACP methyl ester carboxylesterase